MPALPTMRHHALPTYDPWRARRAEEERARAQEAATVAAIAGGVSRLGAGEEEEEEGELPKMRADLAGPASSPAPSDPPASDVRAPLGHLPVLNPAMMRSVSPLTDADERGAAITPATPGAALPVSQNALPTMRTDLASGPVVQPAERRDLGPAPPARNAKGETISHPEYDDTGDERTDLSNYERSLQMLRNPKDRDGRGWSALKRAALGALQGFAQTGSLAGGLGGAISGGVYGAVRPNWNERAERDAEMQRVGQRRSQLFAEDKQQQESTKAAADLRNTEADTRNKLLLPVMRSEEERRAADEAERDNILAQIRDRDEFDPDATDVNTQALVRRAKVLGLTLLKKQRSDKWELSKVGDNTVLFNPRTKEVMGATLNGQPLDPRETRGLTVNDLPDSLFELPDEKQITDMARAEVEPSMQGRRIKPEILTGFWTDKDKNKHPFANPDGSPNMDEIWRAIDLETLSPSEVWENFTDADAQRLAATRKRIREKVSGERGLVDDFRLRVTRNKPNASAVSVPSANVARRFNEIRRMPAGGRREQALKNFYDTLPYMRIE